MNAQHKITKKLNRYKRLLRRCKALPMDDNKRSRKQDLESELRTAGVSLM